MPPLVESDRVFVAGILVGVILGIWLVFAVVIVLRAYERYKRRR